MIDLHSHILPGVDDGSRTLEDARELARTALAEGVTTIAATPHVRDDYPTSASAMEAGVVALRADFRVQGIALRVLHGGELDLGWIDRLDRDELQRFSLGQTGRYVLLEFPDVGWPLALDARLARLRADGFTALLAHPERNTEIRGRPERLAAVREHGALVQVTAGSLEGRFGKRSQATARRLLELDLVDVLASDAHHPELRAYGLAAAAAALRDEGLARHLTEDVPAAIVAGEAAERRPARAAPRWRRFAVSRKRHKLPW